MSKCIPRHKTVPSTVSNKSSNPLPSIHLKLQDNTFNMHEPSFHTNNKIPIQDYLTIMKRNSEIEWSPQKTTNNFILSDLSRFKRVSQKENYKLRMSQIIAKRRHVKFSYEHKDVDLFKKCRLPQIIQAVLGCYQYYEKFGYSIGKITSIVKSFCKDKKQLQWIFLRKVKSQLNTCGFIFQYRTQSTQILNKTLRTVINKAEHLKPIFLRDIINFKKNLQQDLIDKGKGKIKQITTSIKNQKRELKQKIQYMSEEYANILQNKTYHNTISKDDVELVTTVQEMPNNFNQFSKVNRLLYKHFSSIFKKQ